MIAVDPKNPRGLVWIASYPKSGNTWIRIFLYHLMRITGGHPRAENDLDALDRASGYEARLVGLFEQLIGKSLDHCSREEVAAVRMKAQEQIAQRSSEVALVKTHNLMGRIEGTPTINMDVTAGSIYVVRDPRDVVISLADHHGSSIERNIEIMEQSGHITDNRDEAVFEVWGSWSEHVQSWTMVPHDAALILRYEDILADPIKQFTAVAQHLGQSPTEEQMREAVELSSFENVYKEETEKGFRERSQRAERFFRVGKAGQWKEALREVQAARIEEKHREQMIKFGYLNS